MLWYNIRMEYAKKYWYWFFISLGIILAISYFTTGGFAQITTALAAWGTLVLAAIALLTIRAADEREKSRLRSETDRQLIESCDRRDKERRDRKERFLNEIAVWSANVLKLCSKLANPFNMPEVRAQYNNEYLTLKYIGESLLILAENEKFNDILLTPLKSATKCFDNPTEDGLKDNKDTRSDLKRYCETIRKEALKLLKI